jgi:hypothetical protein
VAVECERHAENKGCPHGKEATGDEASGCSRTKPSSTVTTSIKDMLSALHPSSGNQWLTTWVGRGDLSGSLTTIAVASSMEWWPQQAGSDLVLGTMVKKRENWEEIYPRWQWRWGLVQAVEVVRAGCGGAGKEKRWQKRWSRGARWGRERVCMKKENKNKPFSM